MKMLEGIISPFHLLMLIFAAILGAGILALFFIFRLLRKNKPDETRRDA
jgi:hypothetical protein